MARLGGKGWALSIAAAVMIATAALAAIISSKKGIGPLPPTSDRPTFAEAGQGAQAAFPADVRRFDMVCETHGRLLGRPFAETMRAFPPAGTPASAHRFRLSVDLDSMESCGSWCPGMPPDWIAAADSERIDFDAESGLERSLRRSDGRFTHQLHGGETSEAEAGRCRRAPFSGISRPALAAGPGGAAASSDRDSGSLAAMVERLEDEAGQAFEDPLGGERTARLLADARADWRRRFERCPDESCRRALFADRLARLEFAFGRAPSRFPGLAFPAGHMSLSTVDGNVGRILASLTIYPILGDRILISFVSINTPPLMGSCDVFAEGRATPVGGIRMTSLGRPDDPVSRWEIRLEPADRLTIRAVDSNRNPWCGASSAVTGTWQIESAEDSDPA